jgi:hypothetical protein
MENLTPSLACLYYIKRCLAQGISLHEALRAYSFEAKDEFASKLGLWLNYFESNGLSALPDLGLTSDYQKSLLICFEAGLQGQPLQEQLVQLTDEVELASSLEVDEFLSRLPFKAMLPVFLFQLPAFLLLIFGPVFIHLGEGVHYAF